MCATEEGGFWVGVAFVSIVLTNLILIYGLDYNTYSYVGFECFLLGVAKIWRTTVCLALRLFFRLFFGSERHQHHGFMTYSLEMSFQCVDTT
jgi:hypothetical protein